MLLRRFCLAAMAAMALASPQAASSQTWTGTGQTAMWDDALTVFGVKQYRNWGNMPVLPGSASQVVFGLGFASGNPDLNGFRQVGSVVISSPASFSIVNGQLAIGSGSLLDSSASGLHTISASLVFLNTALVTVSSAPGAGSLRLTESISGTVPLSKLGQGVLDIQGAASYTGPTDVIGGALLANNAVQSTGQGPVNVKAGAAIGGEGTVTGQTTIESGGMLAPGASYGNTAGTLTLAGGLSLQDGGVLQMDLGSVASDKVRISGGTYTNQGSVTVDVFDAGGLQAGQTYTLMDWSGAGTISVDAADFAARGAVSGFFSVVGDTLQFTVTRFPIIYVKSSATGANNGTSWEDAYNDLQSALAAATPGSAVWVAEGTYRPAETSTSTTASISFQLKNGVAVYGGFPSAGSPGFQDRDYAQHETVLSGDLAGGWKSYHVVSGSGTNSTAILDGFTITAGRAYGIPATGENRGGGLYNVAGSPTIANCRFTGNAALVGGAMYNEGGSNPTVYNCAFFANTATVGGASGGVAYSNGSNPSYINCTFVNNQSVTGGVFFTSSGTTTLKNCISWGNTATSNPQFFGSTNVTFSCVEGGWDGAGNINKNPQFLDQNGGDLRLQDVSPCADAGSTAAAPLDLSDADGDGNTAVPAPFDLAGSARLAGASIDMGAYEVENPAPPLDAPTGLVAVVVSPSRIDLDWDASNAPGIAGYSIYRSTLDGFAPSLANRIATGVAGNHYSDTGLNNGFTYHYRVTAANALGGESDPSNQATATTTPVAEIIYVDDDAPVGGDGTSWAAAFRNIDEAMEVAGIDDQIWVAAGTYKPADPAGFDPEAILARFYLKNGVTLLGGFPGQPGQEGDLSVRDFLSYRSILSGNILDPGNPNDNTRHVVDGGGTDRTAVLDGFEVSGGGAGGLVALQDNVGGGIRIIGGSPTIRNCLIQDNWALAGAGMFIGSGSEPRIENCVFRGNYTIGGGNVGGGLYSQASSPVVVNCVFADNTTVRGAGVYNESGGAPLYANCTFYGNAASSGASAVWHEFSGAGTFHNCIFWGNTGTTKQVDISPSSSITVTHSCIQGGYAGENNISEDPLFVDAPNGDLRLSSGSPCIDVGENSAVPAGILTDLSGGVRIAGGSVDMGALEFQPPISTIVGARQSPDGSAAVIAGAVVSRAYAAFFYIESPDRTAGIRVEMNGHSLQAGDLANVAGLVRTNADGERYIAAASAVAAGQGSVDALGMPNRTLGGGDWAYNAFTGAGQQGVAGGSGLNNIGLLVRTWGVVTHSQPGLFYIDDGSGLTDGSGHTGVRVDAQGLVPPVPGSYVSVTGASSCIRVSGVVQRRIRAASQGDIAETVLP